MNSRRSRIYRARVAVSGLLLLATSNAAAQACLGISGRHTHLLNFGGAVLSAPNSMNYRLRAGAAGEKVFGGVRLEAFEIVGATKLNAFAVNLDAGTPRMLGAMRQWSICPLVEWNYLSGEASDVDKDLTFSSARVSAGAALGRESRVSERVVLLPFASASFIKRWSKEVFKSYDPRDNRFFADDYFVLNAGTGVQIDKKFVVSAFTRRAVGIRGRFEYGAGVGYLFSRKRQPDPFGRSREIGRSQNR